MRLKRRLRDHLLLYLAASLILTVSTLPAEAQEPAHEWWVEFFTMPYVYSDWGTPAGMDYDAVHGEMLMTDAQKQRVLVFDAQGFERYRFSHTRSETSFIDRPYAEPHDILVTAEGLMYLTDYLGANVTIHSFRGDRIGELDVVGALGVGPRDVRAEDLAQGPDGTIWVSTSGNTPGILGFDADDRVVARIGYDLEGYERLSQPTALAASTDGSLWVADGQGFPVIRHYSADGRYLGGFGGREIADKDFSLASDILCAEDGTLWIADQLRQAVKHLTTEGELIEIIGGYGVDPGDLRYPVALAGDGVDEVYVCERVGRRIQRYYKVMAADLPALEARQP